jgi:hypothetical protein
MPLFNDAKMQKFGNLLEKLGMPDSCIIKRSVVTDTAYGQTEELVVIAESACLVGDPASAGSAQLLQAYADRLGSLVSWPISVPLGVDIAIGDILVVTSRLIAQSQEMKVQIALAPKSFAVSSNFIASEVIPS